MEHIEDISPTGASELRDHFVGARVTRTQYERINAIAKNCDMSVSDYILARCYGYEPKARLTPAEIEATQSLICYRKDLLAYTNALKAMAPNARFSLFDNVEFMCGWSEMIAQDRNTCKTIIDGWSAGNKVPDSRPIMKGFHT